MKIEEYLNFFKISLLNLNLTPWRKQDKLIDLFIKQMASVLDLSKSLKVKNEEYYCMG